jgi:hypothetical protein
MKKAATALCTAALIAAVPATGIASAGSGDAPAAHAAKNKKKLKKCIHNAQLHYQGGPAYDKAVKKCKKKFG